MNYVYKITNLTNGKYYIGKRRNKTPETDKYMGSGSEIKNAIATEGFENFKKEILAIFETNDEAASFERELVTKEEAKNPLCYNQHKGGNGGFDHINNVSPEYRANLVAHQKYKLEGKYIGTGKKGWTEESLRKILVQAKINRENGCGITALQKMTPENLILRNAKISKKLSGSNNGAFGTSVYLHKDARSTNERVRFLTGEQPENYITCREWKLKDYKGRNHLRRWITDGENEVFIFRSSDIPDGWALGRSKSIAKKLANKFMGAN